MSKFHTYTQCEKFGVPGGIELEQALERARVVAILDAWGLDNGFEWTCQGRTVTLCTYLEGSDEPFRFTGPTPDAARAAAARAIESGEV